MPVVHIGLKMYIHNFENEIFELQWLFDGASRLSLKGLRATVIENRDENINKAEMSDVPSIWAFIVTGIGDFWRSRLQKCIVLPIKITRMSTLSTLIKNKLFKQTIWF